ncbi:MAG TPA: YceI family protein [Bacteroidia bacterium]|nr:YceI family protein [Bacteroidia bacterium]HNS12813.1 YceI family protein [Bacteroidia bacterium]
MKTTLSLLTLFLAVSAFGQSVFIDKGGKVTFYSEAPLENIEAKHTGVNSILNTSTNEVAFIVPIRGFTFEKELMQEHFNEKYLESDKYPKATYKGSIVDSIDWSVPGTYIVTTTGTFSLHGVEKEIQEQGTFTVDGNKINLQSQFKIAIADYNISIPKLLFQNIADTVLVTLNSDFEPFKK